MARHLVPARQKRRGKMEFEADAAFEFFAELGGKGAIRIEPRHLVFVLVCHQLEEVFGHRFGEFAGTRRSPNFSGADLCNGREIAVGLGLILIFAEEFGPIGNRFVERPDYGRGAGAKLDDAANA